MTYILFGHLDTGLNTTINADNSRNDTSTYIALRHDRVS